MSIPGSGLVPVHIGQPKPGSELEQTLLARLKRERGRHDLRLRVPGTVDWQRHGMQPRWLGMETSDCAVALEPGFFTGHGADERDRFLSGAGRRGEVAVVVAVIGDVKDDSPRNPLSRTDSSVFLSKTLTSVGGRRLPAGTRPEIAPGLGRADHDLALRLLNRAPDAPWWSLHLSDAHTENPGGYNFEYAAEGQLRPILTDALGEPVVAAWVPGSEDQRWYIIPDGTDWDGILDWLMRQALPEYAPGALRRARSLHFTDPNLQTADELTAQQAVDDLEARYGEEKPRLEQALREAKTRAEPVRYGLLYGSGTDLVRAVIQVLTAAGLYTVDLDQELGGTRSADLLISGNGPSKRLVEVKATRGPASERLVGDLERHLATWPELCPGEPVTGGVLVVNHEHKLPPSERAAQVYSRPEFVATLPVTVVSAVELFNWWRVADWPAIRIAMLGADPPLGTVTAVPAEEAMAQPATPRSRRWRWRPAATTNNSSV